MDKLKKNRATVRTSFSKICNLLRGLIAVEQLDVDEIQASFRLLENKNELLSELDREIYDLLLDDENGDEIVLQAEMDGRDDYSRHFNRLKVKVDNLFMNQSNNSVISSNSPQVNVKKRFKLPIIEIKKFGDDVKDWLPFWSQFQKIDKDTDIVAEDKFQYLIQATVPGSRARVLVESFPSTSENYSKAIDSLKARFGRDDLLVEVYVRELLKLILQNMSNKISLSLLYDKLETQLRALESLDVTSEKYAAMLYPLVESCLPEEILRVWQRSSVCDRGTNLQDQLKNLMLFLCKEVENEERITLAVAGFGMKSETKTSLKKTAFQDNCVPTAAGLVNFDDRSSCVFCEESHKSIECPKARKLSLKVKQKMLAKRRLCFICLNSGHIYQKCRYNVDCLMCDGRHVLVMCPKLENQQNNEQAGPFTINKEKEELPVERTLSNNTHPEVMLQTLKVWIHGDNTGCYVRVLFDTGSQRSYVTRKLVEQMGYISLGEERVIHALFGGTQSEPVEHSRYSVRLKNISSNFSCNFEALDQPIICGPISHVCNGPWINELTENGIQISDDQEGPIEVLIGADIVGKLLTGHRYVLNCGMVALETYLGWTLIGKSPLSLPSSSTSMTITTLICKEAQISDLWALDVLGIEDPVEKKNKQELAMATLKHFYETVKITEDGRYEVQMPWLEDYVKLPTNYKLVKKGLDLTVKKLKKDGYFEIYGKVFREWKKIKKKRYCFASGSGVKAKCIQYTRSGRDVKIPSS